MRSAFLAVLLAVAPLATTPAQQPTVAQGQRVRVSHDCRSRTLSTGRIREDCRRQAGTVVTLQRDALALAVPGDSTVRYPLSGIARVEVGDPGSLWLPGGLAGFLVGTVAGSVFVHSGGSTGICSADNQDAVRGPACIGLAALVGGIPGALVGGVMGRLMKTDRWRAIPLWDVLVGLPSGTGRRLELGAILKF